MSAGDAEPDPKLLAYAPASKCGGLWALGGVLVVQEDARRLVLKVPDTFLFVNYR